MIVDLNFDNITEELEETEWWEQSFNLDPFQTIYSNTIYVYSDWSLSVVGGGKSIYLPFVYRCGNENYNQAVYIKLLWTPTH